MSGECNGLTSQKSSSKIQKKPNDKNTREKLKPLRCEIKRSVGLQIENLPVEEIKKAKSMRDVEAISKALGQHFIFTSLQMKSKVKMISEMKLYHIESGKFIFKQNDIGNNFFILVKGQVEVIINDIPVAILNPVESFGELGLLHDYPRSASIKTLTNVYV